MQQSRTPRWTSESVGGHVHDIQSSSKPAVNPHLLHSTPEDVELEFIPVVESDVGLNLKESFAKNSDGHRVLPEDSKVKIEQVAANVTASENKKVGFDGAEDVEDDDEDKYDKNGVGKADADGADAATDIVDDSIIVAARHDGVDVNIDKRFVEVNDVKATGEGSTAPDLSQQVHPTAGVSEPGNIAVTIEATTDSDSSGSTKGRNFQPFTQEPGLRSGFAESEQYSGPRDDAAVRQLDSSGVDQLSDLGKVGNNFGQQEADIVDHRGHWRQQYQPGDMMFPDEFHQHLDHGAHPAEVWKYVHSSPVEEFRNKWPDMQDAYRSWPESVGEHQYHMNHMRADYNSMQHDQKRFVNHQLDSRWSHVHPQNGHYLHSENAWSNQLNRHNPNLVITRLPDEDARGRVHYGDVFNNQQHHGHSYLDDIHQPDIRVDQMYQQQPLGQRYTGRFDDQASHGGFADKSVSSVGSGEQAVGQTENSAVGQPQKPPADKSERDVPVTERTSDPHYYRGADPSSSSHKYTENASPSASAILGGSSDHISGV